MPAVQSLCNRVLLLQGGQVIADGAPGEIVAGYLENELAQTGLPLADRPNRQGDGSARFVSLKIENAEPGQPIHPGSRLKLSIAYQSDRPVARPQFVVSIYDALDTGIYVLHNDFVGGLPETLPPQGVVTCETDPINLTPGRCVIHLELLKGNTRVDYVPYAATFDIETADFYGSGMLPPRDWVLGVLNHRWHLNEG
jgi:lipopolysaccharide transport system ATP-binding protein